MAADEPRRHLLHPLDVIEEAEVVLHLHMPEIVPVADVGHVEFFEHFEHLIFIRDLLETVPAFHAELDVLFGRVIRNAAQAIERPLEIRRRFRLALFHAVDLRLDVFARLSEADFGELDELIREISERRTSEMQHHKFRAEALREVDRLKRKLHRPFALAFIRRRELITVRRRAGDLDRQRAEVMQRGDRHFACLDHFLNAFHQGKADAVPELDARETKAQQLFQHLHTFSVAAGIPTG